MRFLGIYIMLVFLMFGGCISQALVQTEEDPAEQESPSVSSSPSPIPEEIVFDPGSISQEVFENTKINVQQYIEDLNKIIRNKNYPEWRANLSEEYFTEISSSDFLKETSEWPILKNRKIVLHNAEDYFIHVVVPSRANSKVDDIEFTSHNRVKVFTIQIKNNEPERLRLYELEQTGSTWKIIN